MKLEHGKTYLNGQGTPVKIRKERWDCYFVGHSVKGVFMGYYLENGTSIDGEPRWANLVKEQIDIV
jgi:hypothetical protein